MRVGCLILAAGLVTLLGACVYDPVFEGIGCSHDQECPEGYWCAGSGEVSFCTSYEPVDGGPDDGDQGDDDSDQPDGDAGPDVGDPDVDEPDSGDPGVDAADESDPGPGDDGGEPDQDCIEPDQDGDGYDSLKCGGSDCDDDNLDVHPAAQEGPFGSESCQDGLDNNCDGMTDLADAGCGTDWWDLDFRRRRKIAFDNSRQIENLVHFPVQVTLDGGDNGRIDYAHTQDQGQDLRFIDADGQTVLAHEIESWDERATSYVWVRIPRIEAASDTDYIWMYYGNPAASDGQLAPQVWSDGYRAVYHLHDDFDDSTGAYPATNVGTVDNEGRVAAGQEFYANNTTSYVGMGQQLDILQNVPAVTLSAWVHAHTIGIGNSCVVWISRPKQNAVDQPYRARALMCLVDYNDVEVGGRSRDNENYQQVRTTSHPIALREWHYVVGVIDYPGDLMSVYVDGQLAQSEPTNFVRETSSDTSSPRSTIGSHPDHFQFPFDGLLDEIRVSATVRSADWINAQYISMINQFLVFHGEESLD